MLPNGIFWKSTHGIQSHSRMEDGINGTILKTFDKYRPIFGGGRTCFNEYQMPKYIVPTGF